MSSTDLFQSLSDSLRNNHRVSFTAEDGQLVARCGCGWDLHSDQRQKDMQKLITFVVLSALLHSESKTPWPTEDGT